MPIYDKPVRKLISDMIQALGLQPGQVITSGRAVSWFQTHYPKIQPSSVRINLVLLSTNDPNRLHHAVKPEDDLLFKVDRGQFRLYEPGKDPAPIHEFMEGDVAQEEQSLDPDDEGEVAMPQVASSEFLLERDLQFYLAKNLHVIEPGLTLFKGDEGDDGFEFPAGNRYIDILAVDRDGGLVVLELKVSKGYDRVVGQLLRYVNWVRQNLATPGQRVRGMIVCRAISSDLKLACASISDVELFEYQLSVGVSKVPALDLA